MLWVVVGLAVPVVAVLVMYLVGKSLPPHHVASRMIRLHRNAERVWREVTTVEKFMEWRPNLEKVERRPDTKSGRALWTERWPGVGDVDFEVVEVVQGKRLVTKITTTTLPFAGGWTFELEAFNADCTLIISETGVVKPPLFRFLGRFLLGHTKAIDEYLKALGRRLEESVQPLPANNARPAPLSLVYRA